MWCRARSVFADLGPHEFGRIQFWSAGRKLVHMDTPMARQKVLHLAAAMDRMLIPYQHDRSFDVMQQMLEESDHFIAADGFTIGLKVQLDLALRRGHAQCTYQVQTLVVLQTRANGGSAPARRPSSFEWRDQRKPAFIE